MSKKHSASHGVKGRRLIIAAITAVALVAGGAAVVGYRYVRIEQDYSARKALAIDRLERRTDIEAALTDLKLVVQHRPKDIEAISALARGLLLQPQGTRQHVVDAVRYYNLLLELQPDRAEERAEMVRLLDLLGESEGVLKFITPLIELQPSEVRLHRLRTLHQLRTSRVKEAEAAAKQWSEVAAEDFAAQWAYISLLTQNAIDQADAVIHQKLASGNNKSLWTLIDAVRQLGQKETAAANKLLDEILAQPQLPASLSRPLILALDEAGRRADADRVLGNGIKSQADVSLVVLSALRDIDRGNYTRAVETLQNAPTPLDPIARAIQNVVSAYVAQRTNHTSLSARAVADLDEISIEYCFSWRAVLEATRPEPITPTRARELLPSLRSSVLINEGVPLLQLATANCLIALDQGRAGDRLLTEASRASVGWSPAARRLFELRKAQGQVVQAVEAAQFAFNKSGRTIDSAILLARAVADSEPAGTQAENLLQLLREIQRSVPGEVQTVGLYVDALAARGDPSAASVLRDALERNATVPLEYLLQWAELSQQRGLNLENDCLAKAEADFGVTPRLAFAKALSKHRAGRSDEALAELRATRATHGDKRRAYDEAIANFLLHTRSPDAREAWNALAAASPDDVDLQVRLLDLGFAQTPEEVQTVIARIRKSEPSNLRAELADIQLAMSASSGRTGTDAAIVRLNRLLERSPDFFKARLLLIDLLAKTDQPQAAVAQWEKASQLAPDEPQLILAGAQLLLVNGERTRATEALGRLERLGPNLSLQQRLAEAKVYLALGDPARTIAILEPLKDLPQDARLSLTEAYYRSGNPDAGEAQLKELLKQPDLDTLLFAAAVEDSQGRHDEAVALMAQANAFAQRSEVDRLRVARFASERGGLDRVLSILSSGSVSTDTTVLLAQLWIEQGDVESAMKVLREAAAMGPETSSLRLRLKEEAIIRDLVALGLPGVASQLLLAPDDPGTRQMVDFALHTQKQTLREQQQSLDRLSAVEQPSYALQMFVAERLLAMNQPMAAETRARAAAALRPSAPQPMAMAALAAARAGNTGRCAQAIKDWRERLPADSSAPDALDAQNLARRKEHTELLARYEPKLWTGSAALEVRLAVAQSMLARGRAADALKVLSPIIQADSKAATRWFEIASTELEPSSAGPAIETFRKVIEQRNLPNERVVFAIAMDRVARRARNAAWAEQASEMLAAMEAEANQLPPEAVIRLADNRVDKGDLAAAESLYRKAIAPRSDPAMLEARLAEVLRRQSKLDEALAAIDRALTSPSAAAFMYDVRAAILQDAKRLDEALLSAQMAQQLDGLNPRWLLRVVSLQIAKGDLVTARPSFEMLRWFFREPDAWEKDLIARFHEVEAALTRRPTTTPAQ